MTKDRIRKRCYEMCNKGVDVNFHRDVLRLLDDNDTLKEENKKLKKKKEEVA
jgi:hypothetical protein